jgi:hypothetical protein
MTMDLNIPYDSLTLLLAYSCCDACAAICVLNLSCPHVCQQTDLVINRAASAAPEFTRNLKLLQSSHAARRRAQPHVLQ